MIEFCGNNLAFTYQGLAMDSDIHVGIMFASSNISTIRTLELIVRWLAMLTTPMLFSRWHNVVT